MQSDCDLCNHTKFAQKAIRAAKAEAEQAAGHGATPQITGLDEKELMERFICEVVSLIRVHEIFSDALENIAAKIFEESLKLYVFKTPQDHSSSNAPV